MVNSDVWLAGWIVIAVVGSVYSLRQLRALDRLRTGAKISYRSLFFLCSVVCAFCIGSLVTTTSRGCEYGSIGKVDTVTLPPTRGPVGPQSSRVMFGTVTVRRMTFQLPVHSSSPQRICVCYRKTFLGLFDEAMVASSELCSSTGDPEG